MRFASLVGRLEGAGARAWDIHYAALEARAAGRDVILASVGDPDMDTPAPIVDRAVEALRAGDTHYSAIRGRPALREAIARRLAARGIACGADDVVVTAGAQNALFATALCLFEAGDEILVVEPAYVTYEATFGLTGARLVRVETSAGAGFRLDAGALAAAVTPRTRGILLANPNNPTGVVMTDAELAAVASLAVRHGLWAVVDEVYADLAFERSHRSLAAWPGMAERTVTIGSLSKSHAMTGWRLGWAVGPAPYPRHVERLALNMIYGLPGFIQEAAIVALAGDAAATEAMRAVYRRRRDLVVDALAGTPGLDILAPEAGMFVLLDVRRSPVPPLDLAWAIFREGGVSLLDASAFGEAAHGFLRMTFALDEATLAEACRRLRAVFEELAAGR